MSAMRKQAPERQWEVSLATEADWAGMWEIFHDVVQGGDTYSYAADTSEAEAKNLWMGAGKYGTGALAYVAKDGDKVVGTYSLRRNHYGHGAHVANAGYMVHKDYRGQGVARALCKHSLDEARKQGCLSMQYNYVVSTNTRAVELWQAMGFKIIGISPKSYRHATLGYVDIYIMHRFLDGVEA
jgi:ribosomal protein S18 acetylase RimI-like enzyme